MNNDAPQQKVLLTYQDAKYTRLVIYLLLFALSYGYARFSHGREDRVPWYDKIALVVIFFSFFLSIFEALFLFNAKLFYKRVSFDGAGIYVISRRHETVIPLGKIKRIDMLNTGMGSRGAVYGYEISYIDADGNKAWFYVTIYWKKTNAFAQFTSLVKQKNPAVEIKTVKSGIHGIIRLFKRKKQAA